MRINLEYIFFFKQRILSTNIPEKSEFLILRSNKMLRCALLAWTAVHVSFFILFSSFNRVCRVTNDRKISYIPVIYRNARDTRKFRAEIIRPPFSSHFSRAGCPAIAAAGGAELFYENPVAESYWNWQAIAQRRALHSDTALPYRNL